MTAKACPLPPAVMARVSSCLFRFFAEQRARLANAAGLIRLAAGPGTQQSRFLAASDAQDHATRVMRDTRVLVDEGGLPWRLQARAVAQLDRAVELEAEAEALVNITWRTRGSVWDFPKRDFSVVVAGFRKAPAKFRRLRAANQVTA